MSKYYKKYLLYKAKYINLKYGGGIDDVISENKESLSTALFTDRFITPQQLDLVSVDPDFLYKIIFLFIKLNKPMGYKLLNLKKGEEFYGKIDILIDVSKLIYNNLMKVIKKRTILLIPGDSPSYFFFIIKVIHPELLTDPRIKICEFPASSLGRYKAADDYRSIKYFESLLDLSDLSLADNIIILDYMQSGDSVKYIEKNIKDIYSMNGQELRDDNFIKINIKNYFLKKKEIKNYKKMIDKSNRYYDEIFPANFPDEYPDHLYDHITLMEFIVDGDFLRCQYKFNMTDALKFLDPTNETKNLTEYIKLNSSEQLSNIHLDCNIFLYFLYYYIKNRDEIIYKTHELLEKLTKR
jgi:hypothetical protein